MSINLYEINEQIRQILEDGFSGEIDPETGEVLDDGADKLEQLELLRKDKLEGVALYIKDLTALAEGIREEERKQAERRKAIERKAERLRDYLATALTENNENKFETERCAVRVHTSTRVEVNEALLGREWCKEQVTYKPELERIRKAMQAGETINGAALVQKQRAVVK